MTQEKITKESMRKKLIDEQLLQVHSVVKTSDNNLVVDWFIKPNWYTNSQFGQLLIKPEINKEGNMTLTILDDEMMPKVYREHVMSLLVQRLIG